MLICPAKSNELPASTDPRVNDLADGLDYAHQVLFRPAFADEEFQKAQQIQLARITARRGNSQAEILDFWSTKLPKTSPFSHTVLGTSQTVAKLTAADCRQLHKRLFTPGNMVDYPPDKCNCDDQQYHCDDGRLPTRHGNRSTSGHRMVECFSELANSLISIFRVLL